MNNLNFPSLQNIEKLNGKTILITGSSRGIGLGIAKFLKANTKINIITTGTAPAAQYEMMGHFDREFLDYKQVHYYPMNINNFESVEFVLNNIYNKFGSIDILVNNAGVGNFKPFTELTMEDFESTMHTNFKAAFNLTKQVIDKMISNRDGMIVNISSIAHYEKFKNSSLYAASKSALSSFAKVVREEVREHNIKVTNVFPGATKTDIWGASSIEKYGERMMSIEELGNVIGMNIVMNYIYDLMIEDITIRPVLGDL